jgi:hypothetical protein
MLMHRVVECLRPHQPSPESQKAGGLDGFTYFLQALILAEFLSYILYLLYLMP